MIHPIFLSARPSQKATTFLSKQNIAQFLIRLLRNLQNLVSEKLKATISELRNQ